MSQRATILAAIASGLHRTREIARETGIARHVVQIRIARLLASGAIVTFGAYQTKKAGRPEKLYCLTGVYCALPRPQAGHYATVLRTIREFGQATNSRIEALTGINRNSANKALTRLHARGKLRRVGTERNTNFGTKPYLYELAEAA